jgi:hypothetical protein
MMAKVVNLRTVRKQKARDTARDDATAKAAQHGRSKADRKVQADAALRADRHLDQHKLDET